ncbi:MAG: response regulator, partial [Variovorax sp.]|nr:response regulator [Variovorax sp.]
MQPLNDALIFIVDDDASVREALAWLLRSRRLESEHFATAEAFEERLIDMPVTERPHCLLLDVRMPGTSGLVLFDRLAERGLLDAMPVIFLTG